jgi:hypothetical protein
LDWNFVKNRQKINKKSTKNQQKNQQKRSIKKHGRLKITQLFNKNFTSGGPLLG